MYHIGVSSIVTKVGSVLISEGDSGVCLCLLTLLLILCRDDNGGFYIDDLNITNDLYISLLNHAIDKNINDIEEQISVTNDIKDDNNVKKIKINNTLFNTPSFSLSVSTSTPNRAYTSISNSASNSANNSANNSSIRKKRKFKGIISNNSTDNAIIDLTSNDINYISSNNISSSNNSSNISSLQQRGCYSEDTVNTISPSYHELITELFILSPSLFTLLFGNITI